jgi:histidine triad (HIT) family protein
MMRCPFCEIVAGRAPGVFATWRDAVAIEPLNPVTPGHLLVVPRQHVADAAENPQVAAVTMERAAALAIRYDAANIITSIGEAATQTVEHLHLHVVPRRPGDGLALPWTGQRADPAHDPAPDLADLGLTEERIG